MGMFLDFLNEKIITKVNAKGEKTKRKKCKPGYKLENGKCVPITGADKAAKKKAIRKAVRTKKSKGSGYFKKISKKTAKAIKKRDQLGVK